MNQLEIKKNNHGKLVIQLTVRDPDDWPIAERLAGSMTNEIQGVFEYTLSALNLQRIYSVFMGPKRPVLRGGSFFMDKKRDELRNYVTGTNRVVELLQHERLPVVPNGKFIPYAHQTQAVGVIEVYPHAAVILDCGTGKTGSVARAIELAIERGEVMRGKILVSAPLTILKTSWVADVNKFTNLTPCVLRVKESNKDILGEERPLHDFGPEPDDTVSVKKRKKTFYRHDKHGGVVEEMNTLTKATGPWTKFRGTVSMSINMNGEERPFGWVTGRAVTKEETKKIKLREMLDDPKNDIFLINHDGVKIYEDLLKEHGFAWVIVDESTEIKSPSSKTFKSHVDISWNCKRRNIMTGTPNPNGFKDLWAQYYFLDRGLTLEGSMKDFLAEYFIPIRIGHFRGKDAIEWTINAANRDRIVSRIKRTGIFKNQRDCIDLPPRVDMEREVAMTSEQAKAYLEMEKELITEFTDARTSQRVRAEAVNTLVKMMKLRQITSGFMAGEEGIKGVFDINPKLDDLDKFLENFGDNKLIIVCQFTEEIKIVLERYKDIGITHIAGDVKVDDRDQRVIDFQTTDKYRAMVLQPAAAAHGLTLTASSYTFFLSLDYNFEYYYQVAKRTERLGQKNNLFVIHSLATLEDGGETIDHDLLSVLKEKNKDRDILFSETRDVPDLAQALAERMIKRSKSRL